MLHFFTENFTIGFSINSHHKKCFTRNDKSLFTLTDKWLTRKSRQLMVDRDKVLNDEDYEICFDLKNQCTISNNNDFNRFHRNLIEAAESDRKKLMLINEVGNSVKIKPRIYNLRNVFRDYATETKKMLTFWTIVSLHLGNSKALSIHCRFPGYAILNKRI